MEQLRLVIPDISLAEEIRAYRADMLRAGSSMDGCGGVYESTQWEQNEQARVERYWIDV